MWLWLPWSYAIANAVWVGYPRSLLPGFTLSISQVIADVVEGPVYVGIVGYGAFRSYNRRHHSSSIQLNYGRAGILSAPKS